MNIFELKIWDDEGSKCTFYTVQYEDTSKNETDLFLEKYESNSEFKDAVQELLAFVLHVIGDEHGADEALFNRYENEVSGLPLKGKLKIGELFYFYPSFQLRLYALKITDEIVVLFGGGVKDGPTNQTSSLHLKWKEACGFAKKITDALLAKEILIDACNRKLTNQLGEDEIIL